jgi:hypothetical protein
MKYKVGDKVEFISSTGESETCDHCGNEEWKEKEERSIGTITNVKITDQYYSPAMWNTEEDVTINPDGTRTYKPYGLPKPTPKIAFYTVTGYGASITDRVIIRKVE